MLSIVLTRRDWREADQIVSLYTLEKGKVEALSKGIKKITSKNAAFLLPFFCIEAEIIEGKEITRLLRAQPIKSYKNIRADFKKSLAAGYVVDFLGRILQPDAPDRELFDLLGGWLDFLDANAFRGILLDAFFVKLYRILGFDITKNGKSTEILNYLLDQGWSAMYDLVAKDGEVELAHRDIHKFIQYCAERPVADWASITEFTEFSCQF